MADRRVRTPSRPEELLGRAAGLLRRRGNLEAVAFLRAVRYARLWEIPTTGDYGEHIPGTQGLAMYVPPERLDAWDELEYDVTEALLAVSRHVKGKLVTEASALPLVDEYDPHWRERP